MRRKQPCFDFIRNVMFNLEKNSPVEEDKKKSNLLSNLSVDNVAAENEEEKASRTHLKLWKKLRRLLTTKPVQSISRTQDMSSLYGRHSLAVPTEPIGKAFTDGSNFAGRTGSAWEAAVKC